MAIIGQRQRDQKEAGDRTLGKHDARRSGGLDGCCSGDSEFGRDDYQGMRIAGSLWRVFRGDRIDCDGRRVDQPATTNIMSCHDHLYRNIPPQSARPALVLEGMRRRIGRDCSRPIRGCEHGAGSGRSARAEAVARFGRARRTSSSCSWPARPVTWSCSITSRSSRSSTARCRPPSCSRDIGLRSSIRIRSCLGRSSNSPSMGRCGAELSELLPHLAEVVDDIAIVKSMVTDAFNHAPGQILMSTGSQQFGKPSLGAWTLYGLGSETQNLPGFRRVQHGQEGTERRKFELGQRLFADGVSGRHVPHERRSGVVFVESTRRGSTNCSAIRSTR